MLTEPALARIEYWGIGPPGRRNSPLSTLSDMTFRTCYVLVLPRELVSTSAEEETDW